MKKKLLRRFKMMSFYSLLGLMLQLICINLLLANDLNAQGKPQSVEDVYVSLELKNANLVEVFKAIEAQTNYRFAFDKKDLDKQLTVTFDAHQKSIKDVLLQISQLASLKFRQVNFDIDISRIEGSRDIAVVQVALQQKTISGTVVSGEDESGLPGVNVILKGTSEGTVTDVDGHYSLEVPSDDAILIFSSIGFVKEEVAVGSKSIIDIALLPDITSLEEIVVVGYGEQKKETLTGAISSISSKDIQRSQATTTSGALVGKIAGVNSRMSDGRPGNSTTIQIRNMGTPLYVIDGIQKGEGQFNNLDFNDIESISILKDASAAIYGVRAANGVVVVTTKKGARNTKNVVNVNTYYGWQKMFKFPEPANASTYVKSYIQSDAITGSTPKYTMEDLEKWEQGTEKGYRPFDWYDYILTTAPQSYFGINTSGGSENINYYIALSHLDQQAAIRNYGGFYRTNIQMNLNANISEKLKIGGSLNGRIEDRKHPGVPGADDTWQALFAVYRNLPTARPFANDNPKYPAMTSSNSATNFGMLNYGMSGVFEDEWKVIQLNLDAEYEILEDLTLKGLVGYYQANRWMDNQEYTYKLYDYDEATDSYDVVFSMDNPYRERDIREVTELTSQLQFSYQKNIGKHGVSAVFASETYKRDNPIIYVHSVPSSNSLNLIDFEELDTYDDTGDNTETRLGYAGRVNYNYDEKYLVEFSARYDGSWKFPKEDRWGFFPSASVGWRISEENFWKAMPIAQVLDNLKIRASYGLLGDDEIDGYGSFDYMSGYSYYNGGAVLDGTYYTGAVPRGLPVTSISWIEAKILDIGLDFGLFGNKITGTLDYFDRMRDGLPAARYDVLIPAEVGYSLPNENLESDRTKGLDGSLAYNGKFGDVYFSVGGSFTYARKYDWHQYKPRFGHTWGEYRNSIDERYSGISWGYQCIGQFQSWEEIEAYQTDIDGQGNTTLRPGDLIYKDVNGDGVISALDERPIGYPQGTTPIFNFGFNFSCSWKGFDLAVDFAGASGYSYRMQYESKLPFHDGGNNAQSYMSNQWHLADPSDPDSELIPGKYPTLIVGNSGHSNYWNSDFWMVKGRYVKLKNLEIGYTLPDKWVEKVALSKVRVYTMGQNLFSLDNLNGVDPEITTGSGIQYPTNKVMSVGLNVTF